MLKKILLISSILTAISFDVSASANHTGKTYFQADVGYGVQRTRRIIPGDVSVKENGDGYIFRGALGYYLSDLVRADLQLHYDEESAKKSGVKNEIESVGGLLNVYYDIRNSSSVTPYLAAGVGYMNNKMKASDTDTSGGVYNADKSKGDFAYKLGFGGSVEVDPMVDIDLGYNYIFKHGADFKFANSLGAAGEVKFNGMHAFLVGVRFNY